MSSPSTKSEPEVKKDVDQENTDMTKKSSKKKCKSDTARRRTKTGCVTCRERRVKCDEQKPVCRNCSKSRRNCKGYRPANNRQPSQPGSAHSEMYDTQYGQNVMVPDPFTYDAQTPFTEYSLDYMQYPMLQTQQPTYDQMMTANWVHSMDPVTMGPVIAGQLGQWSPDPNAYNGCMTTTQGYPVEYNIPNYMSPIHIASYGSYPVTT